MCGDCTDAGGSERVFYCNDGNFNVTALVSTNGTVVERYTYDPYGKVAIRDAAWQPITWDASQKNVCLYTGHKLDAESGLYYSIYRYYHPGLGRWWSRDPLLGVKGCHDVRGNSERTVLEQYTTSSDYRLYLPGRGTSVRSNVVGQYGDYNLYVVADNNAIASADPLGLSCVGNLICRIKVMKTPDTEISSASEVPISTVTSLPSSGVFEFDDTLTTLVDGTLSVYPVIKIKKRKSAVYLKNNFPNDFYLLDNQHKTPFVSVPTPGGDYVRYSTTLPTFGPHPLEAVKEHEIGHAEEFFGVWGIVRQAAITSFQANPPTSAADASSKLFDVHYKTQAEATYGEYDGMAYGRELNWWTANGTLQATGKNVLKVAPWSIPEGQLNDTGAQPKAYKLK